ncbi:mobile element protein [Streptomyces ipomoeae]|uniref:mobile element protein n=1 Tax=Streptomyces ipomoeae TaxID=103232 RepID=UPI0029ACB2F8|nr:mobile element protein [Streptomyces ipomoeae]MDX2694954.1 mobile element protein [Streptomyces ipomoeae]MDX2840835.1 mobile element protein [Streptomyces ipomoeae]
MAEEFLADPAEIAVNLGRSEDDPKLLSRLRSASARFRGQVGHSVYPVTTETVTLNGNGRESLLLPVWPTVAVATVVLEGVTLVEGTDYQWSEEGILRRLGCKVWPAKLRCLQVTYSHGWATRPADVAEVVGERTEAAFTIPVGVQSQAVGGQSVTFGAQAASGSTEAWVKTVDRHKVRASGDV